MSQTPRQNVEQKPANLTALRQTLEELALRVRTSHRSDGQRPGRFDGPAIFIRGK